jgi:hypothetical protein
MVRRTSSSFAGRTWTAYRGDVYPMRGKPQTCQLLRANLWQHAGKPLPCYLSRNLLQLWKMCIVKHRKPRRSKMAGCYQGQADGFTAVHRPSFVLCVELLHVCILAFSLPTRRATGILYVQACSKSLGTPATPRTPHQKPSPFHNQSSKYKATLIECSYMLNNILPLSMTSFCINYSLHSSWHGFHQFIYTFLKNEFPLLRGLLK